MITLQHTPSSGKGKTMRHARSVAQFGAYTMVAMYTPAGVTYSFFEEGFDGYRMVTKDNQGAYNQLKAHIQQAQG